VVWRAAIEGEEKNNGTVAGVSCFSCAAKKGIFVQLNKIVSKIAADYKLQPEHRKVEVPPKPDQLLISHAGHNENRRLFTLRNAERKDDEFGKDLLEGLRLLLWMRSNIESLKRIKEITQQAFLPHVQKNSADLCRSIMKDLRDINISARYDMATSCLDAQGMAEGVAKAGVFFGNFKS